MGISSSSSDLTSSSLPLLELGASEKLNVLGEETLMMRGVLVEEAGREPELALALELGWENRRGVGVGGGLFEGDEEDGADTETEVEG
jgi:hypothetical protein